MTCWRARTGPSRSPSSTATPISRCGRWPTADSPSSRRDGSARASPVSTRPWPRSREGSCGIRRSPGSRSAPCCRPATAAATCAGPRSGTGSSTSWCSSRLGGRPRVLHTHCRVAYGSVLFRVGRWPEAEQVMLEALGPNGSRSIGHRIDNTARLAELRIDQGRIEEAAQLAGPHAEALAMCGPMARIHLCRGEHDLAVAVAGRGLRELVGDAVRRGPLLAITVQAELGRGDLDAAERSAGELAVLADETDSPALHGEAQLAAGRVAIGARRSQRRRDVAGRSPAELQSGRAAAAIRNCRARAGGVVGRRRQAQRRRRRGASGTGRAHSSRSEPVRRPGRRPATRSRRRRPECGHRTPPPPWDRSPGGRRRCSP